VTDDARPDRHALLELQALLIQIAALRGEGDADRFVTDDRYCERDPNQDSMRSYPALTLSRGTNDLRSAHLRAGWLGADCREVKRGCRALVKMRTPAATAAVPSGRTCAAK
jgi:hypothetical protein